MSSIWDLITKETTIQLSKLDININFGNPEPKNDAHVKAKTGISSCFWAFAKRKTDHAVWVELELRPKKGYPQDNLFSYIEKNKFSIEKRLEAPIELTYNGQHRRISSYLQNTNKPNLNDCVERMVSFVTSIQPYLFEYNNLNSHSTKHYISLAEYPDDVNIEKAYHKLSLADGKDVEIERVLDQIEIDFNKQSRILKPDWRIKTKQKIDILINK